MLTQRKVLAFIDIGTNSTRLLLVRINPNHSYTILRQEREPARLGENEFDNGVLKPNAMNRTILVCKKFAELSKAYGSSQVIAVATSATREAKNQKQFLERIRKEARLSVKVISGREEARLIYLGISSGVNLEEGKAAFIDIGGGSTEIIIGDRTRYSYVESIDVGAVRLTGMFLPDGGRKKVSQKTYRKMLLYTRNRMLYANQRMRKEGIKLAFGSSGTIVNLGEMASKLNGKPLAGRNLALRHKDLKKLITRLCSQPLEQRKKIPGISAGRADIIIAGAAILDSFMEETGLEKIIISDRGLLFGMLIDHLSKQSGFPQFQRMPARKRSVLQLGRSCGINESHSEAISSVALQLFDSGKDLGIHALGKKERELLSYAAFLHDIGDFISFTNHQQHSHYLINNAELLGFDQEEIRIMAEAARYHRKKTPKKKDLLEAGLDERSSNTVIMLSALLRISESLDRSHKCLIKRAEFTKKGRKDITVTLWPKGNCELETWSIESNAGILKKIFGKKILLRIRNKKKKKRRG